MRFLLIFFAALAIRLWFNFLDRHVNNFASCDAYEYLQNARALLSLSLPEGISSCVYQVLAGNADPLCREMVKSWLLPLHDFKISGPVFPAFLAIVLGISGTALAPGFWLAWPALLLAHSCISAASCVLVALVAQRAFSSNVGIVAGWLACFYPAFIVNSGRLYSETFAAFLSLFLLWLLFLGFHAGGRGFVRLILLAVNAVALQLTRSAMFLFTIFLVPLIFWQERQSRPFRALFVFLAAFMLSVFPWLIFQKLAFDRVSFVVDRVGNYNFFIGNNVDTLGWLSFPYPDGCRVQDKSLASLAGEAFSKSPSRWLKLMLDKPARLFQHPWNDFRTAIGPFSFWYQVRYHQLILCLALLGLSWLFVFAKSSSPSALAEERRNILYRLVLAGFWLFHCIYFAFITVPRYNLTAMPVVIIFAAYALVNCARLLKKRRARRFTFTLLTAAIWLLLLLSFNPALVWQNFIGGNAFAFAEALTHIMRALALLLVIRLQLGSLTHFKGSKLLAKVTCGAVVVFFLPLLLLSVRAEGRAGEWSGQLPAGSKAQFSFDLPPDCPAGFFLLNSADYQAVASSVLEVNGIVLDSIPVPGIALTDDYSRQVALAGSGTRCEGEMIFDAMTAGMGIANMDLRQWYVWALPPAALAAARRTNKMTVTLYSPAQPLPVFGSLSGGAKKIQWPDWRFYSWEKAFYGVENDTGLSDTSLDLGLQPQNGDATREFVIPGSTSGLRIPFVRIIKMNAVVNAAKIQEDLVATAEPNVFRAWQSLEIDAGSNVEKQADRRFCQLLSCRNLVILEVEGKIKGSSQAAPSLQVFVDYEDSEGRIKRYVPTWTPRFIPAGPEWRRFAFAVPLNIEALPGKVTAVSLCLNGTADSVNLFNIRPAQNGMCALRDVSVRARPWLINPVKEMAQ